MTSLSFILPLITFMLFLQAFSLSAQQEYENGDRLYVWAKSGLNIRTAPNLKSEKIGKNGVIIESEGSTGWHYNQIIMPGFSLKHGLLIFLAGTSFEEEYQNDKFQGIERIRLLKKTKPELEFFFGGPDGHYKLLQLGHTLIIEISNGC